MESSGNKRGRPWSSNDRNPRPLKKKFEKLRDARKIAVQSSSPALVSGSIDVNAFTASRTFEIKALQSAMRSSKDALAQRAFQDVPRSLRRRSASHNVKRVIKPLREKAKREMVADGTKPPVKIRGRRRLEMEKNRLARKHTDTAEPAEDMLIDNKSGVPKLKPRKVTKGKFAHRQEDKTWLPTHLYHVKRARVEQRFGFSLPLTPTEKSFRPTYRSSQHSGFIAFDTSYFSTLFVHGDEPIIRALLNMIIEPDSPAAGKRYSSGTRTCETILYRHDEFPRGMIGPALILWKVGEEGLRQLMIRVHPAIVEQVWDELHVCAEIVGNINIEDARFDIGAIDLFGPMATEVLSAVLKVGKGTCSKIWQQLRGLGDTASLPIGAVLDLDLCDPRIDFPPRKIKPLQSPDLSTLIKQWPTYIPGPASLFDTNPRTLASTYLDTHTRGSLQKTRNELLNQGKSPTLTPSDSIIPALLLRRDSGAWTLLLPWSWINDFWYSFMHYPQSRFGGLREYAQICFEKKGMSFPADWPGTKAGDVEGGRLYGEVKRQWERRPEGKRESWGKTLGKERGEIGDPFGCDWSSLFEKPVEKNVSSMEEIRKRAEAAMGDDIAGSHFLFPPGYAKQLLLRKSPLNPSANISQALIPIRLHFIQKGNVSYRARIYRLPIPLEDRQKWTALLNKDAPKPGKKEYPQCPGVEDLLGFVTSGNMSLTEGRGRAVGAVSWIKAESEEERWTDEKKYQRWCIVRDVGMDIARLARWEVNE